MDVRRLWVLLCAALATAAAPMGAVQAAQPDLAQARRAVVAGANSFRQSQGLASLSTQPQLDAAAADFAAYMARTDRYSHEADGRQPSQRAEAKGYAWCLVAENLAYMMSSRGFAADELSQRFVKGWIDSPGHRHNLLAPGATETGVAIAHSAASDRYYAVQMFGRPAALRVRFALSNRSGQSVRYQLGDKSWSLAPGVTREHEQCETPDLRISLPGKAQAVPMQPANGARLRIEPDAAGLRVVNEG
jgi:uncharacterized protein YkwD